jgi:CheY-specific phosphatase CheX
MSRGQKFRKPMMDAISNVLETMFFVAPQFDLSGGRKRGRSLPFDFESNIRIFNGSECLSVFFRTTERFARIITANFMGVDEEKVTVEQMADTIRELANMAAGDFLMRENVGKWELGVPSFELVTTEDKKYPDEESIDIRLSYDEEPMAVGFAACEV